MLKIKIRFSFQESHKLNGDLTFREKEFEFLNKDEEKGFWKGFDAVFSKVYTDYEIIKSEN